MLITPDGRDLIQWQLNNALTRAIRSAGRSQYSPAAVLTIQNSQWAGAQKPHQLIQAASLNFDSCHEECKDWNLGEKVARL